MDLDGAELFEECLAQATMVVKQVRDDQFALPTPCSEWNVRDLAGHMLYELSWVPDVVAGKTIEEVGKKYEGDLLGEDDIDLATHWENAAAKAEEAIRGADLDETAHLSYGDRTVDEYLQETGAEQLIHAWDLGEAIGITVAFEESVAQAVYKNAKSNGDSMRFSGLFAEPKKVSEDADIQTKLLALYGRSADTWRDEQ